MVYVRRRYEVLDMWVDALKLMIQEAEKEASRTMARAEVETRLEK